AYAQHAERYPRPPVAELRAAFDTGAADLLVLPDEPYEFTAEDGPEAFPGVRYALVSGRLLTWYGPSLLAAAEELEVALRG
ncbi:MAG: helical backbone metal receptor, partial [Sciscionella sp.]